MKNSKYYIPFFIITLLMISFTSCGDDDSNQEEIDVFAGCCSDDPVFGPNVDNLDQSVGGEISVSDIVTPNNDAYRDLFGVTNIENYPNHSVTIYNSMDEVVFESTNYVGSLGNQEALFPNGEQTEFGITTHEDGTYKYKIVIEDEQTFMKSGTFCLFTNNPPIEQQNFSECLDEGEFDPILTGF
ncbi:T9SS type B sorting domain-containing protein [Winogradskyella pulchriflava]|uniref:Gliding motility-associated C-terminal domain-containing protein n=1 Tax=Winogradskyella pulchriflava TaxID=1110688 RepID=A0ABV6QCE1_9FLAO